MFVFIGYMIGLTLFVGVVIANYSENKVRRPGCWRAQDIVIIMLIMIIFTAQFLTNL